MSDWEPYLVKGIPVANGATVPTRREIQDISDEEMFLFLEGLKRFQAVPQDDPLSFYQISGIHGAPHGKWPNKPWNTDFDNHKGASFRGFCTHSSILFLTWHRPYLSLYEATLYKHVNAVANAIDQNDPSKSKYVKLAQDFRMPYWDWARQGSAAFPKQALFQQGYPNNSQLFKKPGFKGPNLPAEPGLDNVNNPLFRYAWKGKTDPAFTTLNWFKRDQRGRLVQPIQVIAKRDYDSTQRYPHPTGDSAPQSVVQQMQDWYNDQSDDLARDQTVLPPPSVKPRNLSERTAYLMKAYQRFGPVCFNDFPGSGEGPAGRAEIWGSLEDIHNTVHGVVGGSPGHMSNPDIAAMDPIFWLHHTNIDRLFAIWQALHETSAKETFVTPVKSGGNYMMPNKGLEDVDTPLWPFRQTTGSKGWWTSEGVRRTETFGYAYPEIQEWKYPASQSDRDRLSAFIENYYTGAPGAVAQSLAKDKTAGAFMLEQAEVVSSMAVSDNPSNLSQVSQIESSLPDAQTLLAKSNEPGKPLLRSLTTDNKYLEWLFNVKAEKHAYEGKLLVHVFLGAAPDNVHPALWPTVPGYVGTFATFGRPADTGCEKCQEDAAAGLEVTGQIPLTVALMERYLKNMIPDISPATVTEYLKKELHWRASVGAEEVIADRGVVPGLKVFVISNEVTVSPDPNVPAVYAGNVTIYPEITTKADGTEGRGGGSGLTQAELNGAAA